jgi:FG-GAP repeat protein
MRHKIKALSVLHVVIALLYSFALVMPTLAQKARDTVVTRTSSPPITPPISRKAVAVLQTKLAASDGDAQDFLGVSAAVSGDTAVVGAYDDDSPVADAGSAYVFVRTGSTWTQQQKLVASDAAATDRFGYSVAISGDTIVVGAREDDSPNTDAGSAYVFVRTGSVWSQQQKLVAPDQAPFDNFGVSVAIVGDTIIVGANLSNSPVSNTGAAYVFVRTGSTWTQQQKLIASDSATEGGFGISTAISGDTAVVGAARGGVYVFVRTNTTWTEQQKLISSDGVTRTFGAAVAISGDTAIAGCGSSTTQDTGICVFSRSGTVWSQQQKLSEPNPSSEEPDFFGSAMAIDGNTIVVGAPATDGEDFFTQEDIGAAYIYVRTGSTWHEHQKLFAPDAAAGDGFGFSVAVSGSTILIGSISDDNPAVNSGSAYVYNNAQVAPTLPGQLIISEFRLRGPNGDNDEFVELYNNTDSFIVVDPADGSSGFALVASDGQTRFVITTGTVIPARGHFLGVNNGYGLGAYAAGDISFFPGIPVNAGIALFNTANPSNFIQANRLDAAGSSSEANALFREGGGYAPVSVVDTQYSLLRDLSSGRPADTQDNQADFRVVGPTVIVRTDATYGYPGPENLASPVERNGQFAVGLLDPSQSASAAPNRVRDFLNSTPCSSFGTLSIRRTVTNNTGTTVTRLRFRVVIITTAPAPSDTADLRPISSVDTTVVVTGTPRTVRGTTLETAGGALPNNCGGLNSSLAVPSMTALLASEETKGGSLRRGSQDRRGVAPAMHEAGAVWNEINLDAPLAAGTSLDVQFLLGVQQPGVFRFFVTIEALP